MSRLNLFSFRWACEVDDILIEKSSGGRGHYASGTQEIKFWDNLVFGHSSDQIIMNRGYDLGPGDFYFLRQGRYEDIEGEVLGKTGGESIIFSR